MNKGIKFRIYPTKEQISFFEESVRTSNFIYNTYLRKQIDILDEMNEKFGDDKKERNKYMTENRLWFNIFGYRNEEDKLEGGASKELTEMSKKEEFSFLKKPDTTTRTYVLKQLDEAFANIKKSGGGFPKFKNRFSSFSYTGQVQNDKNKPKSIKIVHIKNKICSLNICKCKDIKFICHIPFFLENWNKIKIIKFNRYTISRKGKNKYYISFQVEVDDLKFKQKEINKKTSIGIDFGVKRPITTSNFDDFNNKTYSQEFGLINRYKKESKKLSSILNRKRDFHKKNKSEIKFYETSAFKRINKKLANLHVKIAHIRENLQHNITAELVKNNNYNTFIIEDLKIKNMTKKSGKGKSNKKSNLNRVLLDVGLGTIKTQLEYKSKAVGKNVITINPQFTSQRCSKCNHVNKLNRQSQSIFLCVSCGHETNADYNAAINIKNKYFEQNT